MTFLVIEKTQGNRKKMKKIKNIQQMTDDKNGINLCETNF